ncbi:MAG TPA: MauE/DoxX family redox-associated membrane protein [Candidatus Nanopelagicaceae bacterium]|nr:MauE/DoxX family redox-associated membrane protein [Candidatus Nanopelagicaceae bacterium]
MNRYYAWLSLLARLTLGGTLLAAGLLKVTHPYTSAAAVRAYRLLPNALANFIGYTLPWVEIGLALALIFGLSLRITSAMSGLLMVAFIIGVASAWARGLTIDCGCFGGGGTVAVGETKYWQEIARDLGLTLIAAYLVWKPKSKFALGE